MSRPHLFSQIIKNEIINWNNLGETLTQTSAAIKMQISRANLRNWKPEKCSREQTEFSTTQTSPIPHSEAASIANLTNPSI